MSAKGFLVKLRPDGSHAEVQGPFALAEAERLCDQAWAKGFCEWRVLPEAEAGGQNPLRPLGLSAPQAISSVVEIQL